MNKHIRRFVLYPFASILLILFLIWAFSGTIAKHYAIKTIKSQGFSDVSIDSIRFNPFLPSLEIKQLSAQKNDKTPLSLKHAYVKSSWMGFFKKTVLISLIDISGFDIRIDQTGDNIVIGGFSLPTEKKEEQSPPKDPPKANPKADKTPWKIVLQNFVLAKSQIHHNSPKLDSDLAIESLGLNQVVADPDLIQAKMEFKGDYNGSPIALKADLNLVQQKGDLTTQIDLKDIQLDRFQKFLPEKIKNLSGLVSLNTQTIVKIDHKNIVIDQKGHTRLASLALFMPPLKTANQEFTVDNTANVVLKDLKPETIHVTGDVKDRHLEVVDENQQIMVAKWDELTVQHIDFNQDKQMKVSLAGLEATGLKLSDPQKNTDADSKPLVDLGKFELNNVHWADNLVLIGKIGFDNLVSHIILTKDRKLANLYTPPKSMTSDETRSEDTHQKTVEKSSTAHATDQDQISIKLKSCEITGNSRIVFEDHGVDPVFKDALDNLSVKIENIDSTQPNQESPYHLTAKIRKYGKLNATGIVKPFLPQPYVRLDTTLSEYPLLDTSSYTKNLLGYYIKSGQMNNTLGLTIENGNIDGTDKLNLFSFNLAPAGTSMTEKLTKRLSMPLDLAVSYISDDKGNLELTIPIKGSLDDPQFGIQNVIQIVMVKALKSAAFSYLKKAVFPYGALAQYGVDAAIFAGKQLMKVRFAPLVFEPGQPDPPKDAQQYVQQLAQLLKKEQKIQIVICPFATPEDLLTDQDKALAPKESKAKLTALAKQRFERLKDILVNQYKIDSSRILDCQPEIATDKDAKPRLEIGIH